LPVPVPGGVKCELNAATLKVTGPKGTLEQALNPDMKIDIGETEIVIARPSDRKEHRQLHGLTRALVNNMVVGVSEGFRKTLVIEGVGYRASMQGKSLNLTLGHSHPISMEAPEGCEFAVDGQQTIHVSGFDKQVVGQVAANIRALRPVEPYKGKGVRYADEYVRRKVSKATVG
jgi:large subunit ribosomal protein L6